MITTKSLIYRAAAFAVVLGLSNSAAFAQGFIRKGTDLPDASRYYMSRLQVQYVDEGPIVNGQANPGAQQGNNQIPGVPQRGLPKASFQGYAPAQTQMSTSLPKVNNGVPPKMGPQHSGPAGASAKAGKLPAGKPSTTVVGPKPVEAYAPYKGYNPQTINSVGANDNSSKANVQGSVLHWARSHH